MLTHAPPTPPLFQAASRCAGGSQAGSWEGGLCFEPEWLLVRYSEEEKNGVD